MRVGLSGATGFLGSHTAEALQSAGHDVVLFVRNREKASRVLAERGVVAAGIFVGDVADSDATKSFLSACDAVVHAAAAFYGDQNTLDANVAGVRNILDQGVRIGLDPIIYVSTIAAMLPPPGDVFTVDDPVVELKTVYGRSKSAGELHARAKQEMGLPVVTIYPGGIHGPNDPGPTEGTKGIRDRVRYGWPRCPGGMPLVDVRDVAEIIARACVAGAGPRRYMAGGNFLPWMEEADVCEKVLGRPVRRVPVPATLIRALGYVFDGIRAIVPSFDYPLTREAATFILENRPCDSAATLLELDFEFRPPEETLRDTIRWLYEVGELTAEQAGKIACD